MRKHGILFMIGDFSFQGHLVLTETEAALTSATIQGLVESVAAMVDTDSRPTRELAGVSFNNIII